MPCRTRYERADRSLHAASLVTRVVPYVVKRSRSPFELTSCFLASHRAPFVASQGRAQRPALRSTTSSMNFLPPTGARERFPSRGRTRSCRRYTEPYGDCAIPRSLTSTAPHPRFAVTSTRMRSHAVAFRPALGKSRTRRRRRGRESPMSGSASVRALAWARPSEMSQSMRWAWEPMRSARSRRRGCRPGPRHEQIARPES